MSTTTQSGTIRFPLGVAALITVAFLMQIGVAKFVDPLVAGSASWLPTFGTVGQTVVIYNLGVTLFAFVLVPVAAFWLGARYGQKLE